MQAETNLNVIRTLTEVKDTVTNLLLLLSEKEKNVIVKRFNLDNTNKLTLEEIGQEYGVTRERVRQIEKNALNKMKRNVFNTTLKNLHDFVSSLLKLNGGIIREDELFDVLDNLLPSNLSFDKNFAHLSFVLQDTINCIGNTILYHPHLKDKSIRDDYLKCLSNNIINQLHKNGDLLQLDKLKGHIISNESSEYSPVFLRSLINVDKRMVLLDGGLVGLLEWRHINPRTLREKILYVLRKEKKPMHFSQISEKISMTKFDKRDVNVQAVHNELIRHSQFVLIGRGIYALSDWGYEKGTVSDVIVSILKEKGSLDLEEIVDLVLEKRQIKRITIQLALKNSERFERIGRKRYCLKK